jgi:3-oxoadipate enol-lactonase
VLHDSGEGPAVLMLHAFPLDASQWDHQVAALSGGYRCLRPDFWGCSSSPPPPGPIDFDGYAATLLAELDARGVGEFAVCGISMGGYAAFALVRAAPQRVTALVLSNTRASAEPDSGRAERAALTETVRAEGIEAVVEPSVQRLLCPRCREEVHIADPVRGRVRRVTVDGYAAIQRAIAGRVDSTAMLGSIRVPTLVVAGSADAIIPIDESRAMAEAIPQARLEVFESSGHLANLEQPQRFSVLVRELLEQLPG